MLSTLGDIINAYPGISGLSGSVFADIADDSVLFTPTSYLKQRGITLGCGDGNYCPDDPVTRGQMALFLYRMSGGGSGISTGTGSGSGTDNTGGGSDITAFINKNKLLLGGAVALILLLSMGRR